MAINLTQIYNDIKRNIVSFNFLPNTKMREEDLAKKYGISRTPIRSVIMRLVSEGLLEVIPQKGTYVTPINLDVVKDASKIRQAMELVALDNIDLITQPQLEFLQTIIDEEKQILALPPSDNRNRLFFLNDSLFHEAIFTFTGYDGIWRLLNTGKVSQNRARIVTVLLQQGCCEAYYQIHATLLRYLNDCNYELSKATFMTRLELGIQYLNQLKIRFPEYFR